MANEQIFPFEMEVGSEATVEPNHEFAGMVIRRVGESHWVEVGGDKVWTHHDFSSALLVIPKA